jgi:hypothetical protein
VRQIKSPLEELEPTGRRVAFGACRAYSDPRGKRSYLETGYAFDRQQLRLKQTVRLLKSLCKKLTELGEILQSSHNFGGLDWIDVLRLAHIPPS